MNLIFSLRTPRLPITLFLLLFAAKLFAAPDTTDYYSDNTLRYDDHVYRKSIKTVQLSPDPAVLSTAIIKLNSDDKLYLSFDDLDGDYKAYSYTLIHCTSKWEPSNILVSEYLDGFEQNPIRDYRFSRNPIQHYTHYSLSFPNDEVKLLRSGNYLLKVFTDKNGEELAFTKRFLVYEDMVSVDANVHAATIVSDRNFKQEVDFTINYNTSEISNPFAEIMPVILQNGRWDNAITGLQPQFVKDKQLVYDYEDGNVFRGGNEFRWFDTRTLRLQTQNVETINKDSAGNYNVYLLPDERRTYKRYVNNNDINGKYLIQTTDGGGSDVDAEYCWVHFFLPWDPPASDGNMYVFGALSNWQCSPDCRMTYNYQLHGYEASMYLKQGYYNYEYVFLKDNVKAADDMFVEGMHYETENDYFILIYFRHQGTYVDQLVAVKHMNSRM